MNSHGYNPKTDGSSTPPIYEVTVTIMIFIDPATPHEYNPKTDGSSTPPIYEVKARPT